VIQAALCDESIRKASFPFLREHLGPKRAGPLPVTLTDGKPRDLLKVGPDLLRESRLTQQLKELVSIAITSGLLAALASRRRIRPYL